MTWVSELSALAEKATGVMFRFEDGGFAVCDPERVRALCDLAEAIDRAHDEHLKIGDYTPLGIAAQDALLALASFEPAREEEV